MELDTRDAWVAAMTGFLEFPALNVTEASFRDYLIDEFAKMANSKCGPEQIASNKALVYLIRDPHGKAEIIVAHMLKDDQWILTIENEQLTLKLTGTADSSWGRGRPVLLTRHFDLRDPTSIDGVMHSLKSWLMRGSCHL